jgi:hypothetical protein
MQPEPRSVILKTSYLRSLCLGVLFGFLHVSLFRELSLKIPINFFFPHFVVLVFTGMAAGLLYGERIRSLLEVRPYLLLLFLAVFLLGIWVYRGDSIFFWTLAMYYPMPIPEYGWIKAVFFLTALVSLPILFFLLALPVSEAIQASRNPGSSFALLFAGMAAGTLLGYPAQFLGPEVMFLIGCLALLVLLLRRPVYWLLGLLLCAGVLLYGHWKQNYPILLSLRNYTLLETRTTDNYKIDFYSFQDGTCIAQAINDFLHVYTCRDYEKLPVELSYFNRVVPEGLRNYRTLIVGSSIGMYPYQLYRANPDLQKCTVVDVDRQLADTVKRTQKAIGLDLYDNERFTVVASEPRHYLEQAKGPYDLLYLHRVGNALVYYPYTLVPIEYYLLTEESLRHIFDNLLEEDGLYILDWGIPEEKEVRQFVISMPEDVHFRAYWTTVSNNPLSGAPLIYVIASKNKTRLDEVSGRIEQASYFHRVREETWPRGYRVTDDKPWLKHDVVAILTSLLLPFLLPVFLLFRHTCRLQGSALWRPRGSGRRYSLMVGFAFAFFNAYTLGRVTRLFPLGVNPGWLLVESVLLLGFGTGAYGALFRVIPAGHQTQSLLISLLCLVGVSLLYTVKSFPLALGIVFLTSLFFGHAFGRGLPGRPPRDRLFLFGFEQLGFAFGIALFQIVVLPLGFRAAGILAVLILLVAGLCWAGQLQRKVLPEQPAIDAH